MKTAVLATVLGGALLAFALFQASQARPASALIHEIVSSFCSGGHGQLDPPGQAREGMSFARALQATGVISLVFGEDPEGNPGDFVTVVFTGKPPAKFSWDGESYETFEEDGLTIFFPVLVPDHPSFERCAKLESGE